MLAQPFAFSRWQTNISGARPAATLGATITGSGSTNTKGSWASLIDPLAFDVYRLHVIVNDVWTSAAAIRALLDIGIGPSGGGSEVVVIPDLLVGGAGDIDGQNRAVAFDFPIYLPAGQRLSARLAGSVASETAQVTAIAYGAPTGPCWAGAAVEALGISAGSSAGVAVTSGTTSEGSWVTVGTTSFDWAGFAVGMQNDTDTTNTSEVYSIDIGLGSTPDVILVEDIIAGSINTEEVGNWCYPNYLPFPIAAGTVVRIRAQGSGAAQANQFALYGVRG